MKFKSGVSAVFESVLAPGAISDQPFFVIQGTEGEIVLDGFEGGGRVYTINKSEATSAANGGAMLCTDINAGHSGPVGWDTGYRGELLDFAGAVVDGVAPKATATDAVEDLR
jgi:predicted dehydrogenase